MLLRVVAFLLYSLSSASFFLTGVVVRHLGLVLDLREGENVTPEVTLDQGVGVVGEADIAVAHGECYSTCFAGMVLLSSFYRSFPSA